MTIAGIMHIDPFSFYIGQGRKRALLVGINYFKSRNELRGKGYLSKITEPYMTIVLSLRLSRDRLYQ